LYHRGQHMPRSFVVLIRVDADCQLVHGARRFEHALTGRARGVEYHFDALIVLTEGELLSLARILESIGRHTGVLRDDLAVGANSLHSRPIPRLELVDQRNVHPADESDFLRVADERGERANQIRTFFLTEL